MTFAVNKTSLRTIVILAGAFPYLSPIEIEIQKAQMPS